MVFAPLSSNSPKLDKCQNTKKKKLYLQSISILTCYSFVSMLVLMSAVFPVPIEGLIIGVTI